MTTRHLGYASLHVLKDINDKVEQYNSSRNWLRLDYGRKNSLIAIWLYNADFASFLEDAIHANANA